MTTAPDPYLSRKLLAHKLISRGWREQACVVGSRAYILLTSPRGSSWFFPRGIIWYPFVSKAASRTSVQKDVAYTYAELLGVRVPATLALPAASLEIESFLKTHNPVVVKPLDGHGSEGLTLGITTVGQASDAIKYALTVSKRALMQEQITGEEIRFTVVKNKVVSVLLRQTPRVIGDGRSTVVELIAAENKQREALVFDYIRYPQLDATLISSAFLVDQRVLANGEILELSRSTMIRGGASVYNVTDTVHDSYKKTALLLAQNLNPDFLVVDIMIDDLTQPQAKRNYAFIEFNTAPSLKMYYSARDGKQYDMVETIANMIDEEK